jgi:diguanylate cyclase (GGDEF)-like protein
MFNYYTSIILLSWMGLGVLCVLIRENDRLTPSDKRLLYLTYGLIAVSALAEWCGVQLNGRLEYPNWILIFVKTMDYILTPMAAGALVVQMRLNNRWQKSLIAILAANIVFQIISAFTGWVLVVDESHRYNHGPLYGIYLMECMVVVLMLVVEFMLYGRSFRRQNRKSMYAILLLIVAGIALQEALPMGNRTEYIALTLAASLMYIHYTEYSQLAMDDHVLEQQRQIDTDALTGLLNRNAFSRALKEMDAAGHLPETLVAFTIDINDLKGVNDRMGHDAGDELICGAAHCIQEVFGDAGQCYRTGGDEFIALAHMTQEAAEDALLRLERASKGWQGGRVRNMTLAAGYAHAADNDDLSAEKLVHEADLAMYASKAAYYQSVGKDRRQR